MALWGEPGAMIDGMYTLTTDAIITVRLHEQVNGILETCTDMSVMKAGI